MRFFLDNMISYKFALALRAVEKDVVALRERFPENTDDVDWIRTVAPEAPVIITVDRRIRSRPLERRELAEAKLIGLFLQPFFTKTSFQFWDQFVWLVRHWAGIEETVKGLARGSCMALTQNGKMHPLPHV